jgi:hypothetical protein
MLLIVLIAALPVVARPADTDGDGLIDRKDACPLVYDPSNICGPVEEPPPPPTSWECVGTHIRSGDDLDAAINGANATWCVHAGTYPVDQMVTVAQGDNIYAEPGTVEKEITLPSGQVVRDRTAAVKLTNAGNLGRMINVTASSATIDWLGGGGAASVYVDPNGSECINASEITGKCAKGGTGMFMGLGQSGPGVLLTRLDISGNAANCIVGLSGVLRNSELSNCSTDKTYFHFTASALKTTHESELDSNYVHDSGGFGLWCDQGCHDTPERVNGFWVHDNLVVNTDGWGLDYEFSPMLPPGQIASSPSALIENNVSAGNDIGGAQMLDAQNATFRNNSFGPQSVGGVNYPANGNNGLALLLKDNPDRRTDTYNGAAIDNMLHGERITGCDLPDEVVLCSGNG